MSSTEWLSKKDTSAEIPQLTLISHALCPYVQRSIITLKELKIEYKRIDIDLNDPPKWFLELSPLGKVPILVVNDDVVVFESAVIAEYINEVAEGGLLSNAPLDKAREKAWIEFASATLDNIGQIYSASTEKRFTDTVALLDIKWLQLEKNISTEPFFSGESFSLVDAAYAPVFRYLDLFEQLVDIKFLKLYPRLTTWRLRLQERDSVVNAVRPDYQNLLAEFITDRKSYLSGKAELYLAARVAA
jgi:glutathione S-transferase